jgi:hypothetical protein
MNRLSVTSLFLLTFVGYFAVHIACYSQVQSRSLVYIIHFAKKNAAKMKLQIICRIIISANNNKLTGCGCTELGPATCCMTASSEAGLGLLHTIDVTGGSYTGRDAVKGTAADVTASSDAVHTIDLTDGSYTGRDAVIGTYADVTASSVHTIDDRTSTNSTPEKKTAG